MSLLTICQTAAELSGFTAPATIIGNTAPLAVRLKALANAEGKHLMKKYNWSVLQKEHTFSTAASDADYVLPDDYDRMLADTAWDRTNYWQLRGGLSPDEWQFRKSAIVATAQVSKLFRIKPVAGSRQFFIDPTPASVESLVFEYISNQWAGIAAGGSTKVAFTLDDDVSLIDEYVIELGVRWRLRELQGLSYLEQRHEYDEILEATFGADDAPGTLDFTGRDRDRFTVNIPERIPVP